MRCRCGHGWHSHTPLNCYFILCYEPSSLCMCTNFIADNLSTIEYMAQQKGLI